MRQDDMVDYDKGVFGEVASSVGHMLVRNRGAVLGGLAVFAIVGYASANALFFQDGKHPSAFFETRQDHQNRSFQLQADERTLETEADRQPLTRIVFDNVQHPAPRPPAQPTAIEQVPLPIPAPSDLVVTTAAPDPVAPSPASDDPVIDLQTMLAGLGFYEGTLDGIKGPQTRAAVEAYKTSVGLRGIDLTVDELRTSLRNNMMVTAAIPRQRPENAGAVVVSENTDRTRIGDAIEAPVADPTVLRVQAGLKAFGNGDIKVDGVTGPETLAAVREFQALFRLPVTGQIDPALVDKMVAVGLID